MRCTRLCSLKPGVTSGRPRYFKGKVALLADIFLRIALRSMP
jgi:hypothetical protein